MDAFEGPLTPSEIDEFLEFVFSAIARRPQPLRPREVLGVLRCIEWLVRSGLPRAVLAAGSEAITAYNVREEPDEQHLKLCNSAGQISDRLWRSLIGFGVFEACSTESALAFVRRYRSTILAGPDCDRLIEFLERYDLPRDARSPFKPPYLVSPVPTTQGYSRNPHLKDDLSERIWGADLALKQAGLVSRRRRRIAEFLNRAGIHKKRFGSLWGPEDIQQRIKEHEAAYRRRYGDIEYRRNELPNRLIRAYKYDALIKRGTL
jgi:hypothetical protein